MSLSAAKVIEDEVKPDTPIPPEFVFGLSADGDSFVR